MKLLLGLLFCALSLTLSNPSTAYSQSTKKITNMDADGYVKVIYSDGYEEKKTLTYCNFKTIKNSSGKMFFYFNYGTNFKSTEFLPGEYFDVPLVKGLIQKYSYGEPGVDARLLWDGKYLEMREIYDAPSRKGTYSVKIEIDENLETPLRAIVRNDVYWYSAKERNVTVLNCENSAAIAKESQNDKEDKDPTEVIEDKDQNGETDPSNPVSGGIQDKEPTPHEQIKFDNITKMDIDQGYMEIINSDGTKNTKNLTFCEFKTLTDKVGNKMFYFSYGTADKSAEFFPTEYISVPLKRGLIQDYSRPNVFAQLVWNGLNLEIIEEHRTSSITGSYRIKIEIDENLNIPLGAQVRNTEYWKSINESSTTVLDCTNINAVNETQF